MLKITFPNVGLLNLWGCVQSNIVNTPNKSGHVTTALKPMALPHLLCNFATETIWLKNAPILYYFDYLCDKSTDFNNFLVHNILKKTDTGKP